MHLIVEIAVLLLSVNAMQQVMFLNYFKIFQKIHLQAST